LRIEKNGVVCLEPVVGGSVEIGLSVRQKGDVCASETNLGIPAHLPQLFGVVSEWHVLLEEVDLRHDAEKVFDGDLQLCLDPDRHFLGVIVDLVVHADSLFSLIELIPWLIEVFVVVGHGVVLLVDLLDEVVLVLR